MIKFVAVNPTGMFSFGNENTVLLDGLGLVFLQGINEDDGGSNGSGKSSFLNVIKEICYSNNDTGHSGTNVINKHKDWKNGCFGAIWFYDNQNQFWRIFYLKKWKRKPPFDLGQEYLGGPSEVLASGKYTGGDIFLERWDGSIWKDERPTATGKNKTQTDTKNKIIRILGMTYDQFSAYVCLGQSSESALVNGSSGEREKIIQAVTDVSVWDNSTKVLKDNITLQNTEIVTLESKVNGMKLTLSNLSAPTEEEFNSINNSLNTAKMELFNIEKSFEAKKADVTELQQQINGAPDLNKELMELSTKSHSILMEYNSYKDPEKSSDLVSLEQLLYSKLSDHTKIASEISDYQRMSIGKCSSCKQEITGQYLVKEIENLEKQSEELGLEIKDLQSNVDILNQQYEEMVTAGRVIAKQQYESAESKIRVLKEEVLCKQQEHDVNNQKLMLLNNEIQQIQSKITYHKTQVIGLLESSLLALDRRKEEYGRAVSNLEEEVKILEGKQNNLSHYKWVERNIKRIRLQEYTSSIERLNQLIDVELKKLWGSRICVRLVAAQEKSRGKGIKQGLEIMVYTPNKEGIPIGMYSGGETKSIVISVFKAARKLVKERGGGVNIAGIDEIDENLDDVKTDKLVDAFETIREDCSSCFIISHNTRLLNTMHFDRIWTIRKSSEMATLEAA